MTTSGSTPAPAGAWRLGRRPALDGLRGVAVLLVMAHHAEIPGFRQGGGTGVTLFFVLSGFLITALLVEEQRTAGRVDLRAFCTRRAVRLLPALVAFLVVMLALGMTTGRDAGLTLVYAGNWLRAGGDNLGYLGHTWSLAVEEQFYLVWPAAFVLLARRPRWLLGFALAGAVVSAVARQLLWGHGLDRIYFGSDTRADAVLLGCALGLWLAGGRRWRLPRWTVAAAAIGLAALTASRGDLLYHWGFAPAAVASVVLVAHVAGRRPGTVRLLEHRLLTATGRLSYGLYLWHFPVVLWAGPAIRSTPLRLAVEASLSLALAVASATFVEGPLRRRWSPHRPPTIQPTTPDAATPAREAVPTA